MPHPYKTMTQADFAALQEICGSSRVLSGEAIGDDLCHDELAGVKRRPEALVRVKSAEEVSKVLKYASAENIPVTPRGQGTGLVGGSVAIQGGILLDVTGMNRILELDGENMTLTVEPGVLLMEVSKFAEEHGFFYPPDPGEKTAAIGGNISTNAGGMRAVKYGVTRDFVRGLQVVLATGEIMELGGKVVKNSSGYSLKDLIVGSEGTLAVITKAVLRLLPLPKFKVSLLIPFPDLSAAIHAVPEIIRCGATPTAVEFMEREVILAAASFLGRKLGNLPGNACLLLTYDGMTQQEVESNWQAAAETCLKLGALDVLISNTAERDESVWKTRSSLLEAIKASTTEMDECDVVVPRCHVAEFILFAHTLQDKYKVRIRSFGHAGDGNLHIYVLRDDLPESRWHKALSGVFNDLYELARSYGGKVSGEHGIGFAKLPYLGQALSPGEKTLMRGIKAVFDPQNILNPGKVIPD